jgi:hypothetical protein
MTQRHILPTQSQAMVCDGEAAVTERLCGDVFMTRSVSIPGEGILVFLLTPGWLEVVDL